MPGLNTTAAPQMEHRFFFAYAAVAVMVLVVGFAPSYLLPLLGIASERSRVPAPPIVHLHGIIFLAFAAMYLGQTWLIGRGRHVLHRRVGERLGVPMLVAMAVAGSAVAIWGPDRQAQNPQSVAFLAWLAGDIVMILLLMGAALWLRRDGGAHKRLMALAMAVMTGPGLGRILGWLGPPPYVDLAAPPFLFGLAIVGWDLVSRGRLHPATAWGFGGLMLSQAIRIWAMESPGWLPAGAAFLEAAG